MGIFSRRSRDPQFTTTAATSPINRQCISIIAVRGEQVDLAGTGVLIGDHIAITARHVIEGFWHAFEQQKLEGAAKSSFEILAMHTVGDETAKPAIWRSARAYFCPESDLAILRLEPWSAEAREFTDWKRLSINPFPADKGTLLDGFGYASQAVEIVDGEIKWTREPVTTTGVVEDVHHLERDGRLNFPCVLTNARFDGRMSGGPVFDSKGHLRGLICSGMNPVEVDGPYTGYVSVLWPLFATPVDFDRVGFPAGRIYPALHLAAHGFLDVKNWDKITLVEESRDPPVHVISASYFEGTFGVRLRGLNFSRSK